MASECGDDGRSGYLPGLDGIRAIAVGAVVAYHLRVPFFDGGLLGVSVFFTLSGYLITSLLVTGYERNGRVDLKNFWLRRARRLLPALVLMLPVVTFTTAIARPEKLAATAKQALQALLYVANWTTIFRGDDYFQRFSGPGPLDHLWSLAIEEQFYVLWPLVVFGLLAVGARLGRGRVPLAMATVLLGAASTWAIVHLYDPLALNHTRAYEGTDARAASLLVGALVATALPFDRVSALSGRARLALEGLGALGLVGIVLCVALTDEDSPFLYRGGELALSSATVALSVSASHRETLVARVLGVAPLRWIGARSYGIYLWHMPVAAFMPGAVLESHPALRGLVQLGLILGLAAASFHFVEDPIRRRAPAPRPPRARFGLAFRAGVLVPAATALLVVWPLRFHSQDPMEALAAEPMPAVVPLEPPAEPTPPAEPAPPPAPAPTAAAPKNPELTSCTEVVHVGDSTSLGLISAVYLPKATDQIGARYRAVGVAHFLPAISGARSMVEVYKDQPNATEVVKKKKESGYAGCWVMALGTNDPANTAGNAEKLAQRIDAIMAILHDVPVLWTTTRTLLEKSAYKNANMQSWNRTLIEACSRHPNMRVYDWASEVRDDWYVPDGIHFNAPGYKERALRIPRALARAFPKDGPPSPGCVVRADP
jgi:peptidoglycan/LPS O-acetylase OafA/YrhL/lysophospholipase L1-like esterase